MVPKLFPEFTPTGSGWHKIIFKVNYENHILIFKIGRRQTIENDHRTYKRLPAGIRRKYFARIYWHTHYCLLQEYGEETSVTVKELGQIKAIADKYGLIDVGCDNIRRVNGRLKIIDANIADGPTSKVARVLDSVKYKHPWLYQFVRRVLFLWLLLVKQK